MAGGFLGQFAGGLRAKLNLLSRSIGVSPAALSGFAVILVLALVFGFLAFLLPALRPTQLSTLVLSAGEAIDGAQVELATSGGIVVASGVTREGKVVFSRGIPSGIVTVRASKEGFVGADGGKYAVTVVDFSKRQQASIEMFASQVAPGEFAGAISFFVADKLSQKPISGATLKIIYASSSATLVTDAQGRASINLEKGTTLRVVTSFEGYYSDIRAFTAIRPEEKILLSARVQEVAFSSQIGELPSLGDSPKVLEGGADGVDLPNPAELVMPDAIVRVEDSQGNKIQSGSVVVLNSQGVVVATAQVENGAAQLDSLTLSQGYSILVSGADEGSKLTVFDAFSKQAVFSTVVQSGVASISPQPFDSLSVVVRTVQATSVAIGAVQAFDEDTGVLVGQAALSNGIALLKDIGNGAKLKLVLVAPSFSANPVSAIFGKQSSAAIIAMPATAAANETIIYARSEDNAPISATVRVFRKGENVPTVEQPLVGSASFLLAPGEYSAVVSSQGRYVATADSFLSGSRVDVVLPLQGAVIDAMQCATFQGVQSCTKQHFSPLQSFNVDISIASSSGAPVESASVSLRDVLNRTVFATKTGPAGTARAEALLQGSYNLSVWAFGSFYSQRLDVYSDLQPKVALNLSGTLILRAVSPQGGALDARFSAAGSQCSGGVCSLSVPAGTPVAITASAAGSASETVVRSVEAGQTQLVSFELVPEGSQVGVAFQGVFDSTGKQVSSVFAGQDYYLKFSFNSDAADETSLVVRIGERQNVAGEPAGLLDFGSSENYWAFKSTSYSPQPTCVDLNNNNPDGSLFKWAELSFQNKGAPIHKTIAIPVRLKPAAAQNKLKIFYRVAARSGTSVLRQPPDLELAQDESTPSKAGCYADSRETDVPIVLLNACRDGTAPNSCSFNTPLRCTPGQSGASLVANEECCPAVTSLSQGLCIVASPGSGKCADGTSPNECSQINKPYLCSSGTLAPSSSCCAAGELFENGVCRQKVAGCVLAGQSFPDGECLASKPLRCLNGVESPDAAQCGCPQGTAVASGSCVAASCDDGTALNQCSNVLGNFLKLCSAGQGAPALRQSNVCSCPAAMREYSGQCVACATTDCGEPAESLCLFGGQQFSQGCIAGNAPLLCGAGGILSSSPVQCGCQQGQVFDSSSGVCSSVTALSCPDGTQPSECSQSKPLKCVLVSGRPVMVDSALECGCAEGLKFDGVACIQSQASSSNPTPSPSPSVITTTVAYSNNRVSVPAASCQRNSTCTSPDKSDEYCDYRGKLGNSCSVCNRNCGNNELLACNTVTGSCEPVKCAVPAAGGGTPAGQCIVDVTSPDRYKPYRCVLGPTKQGILIEDAGSCGCPAGMKPDDGGEACMRCEKTDCFDALKSCVAPDGSKFRAFQCLGEKYSTLNGETAQAIKVCTANGTISTDIEACGCPTGFQRSSDNLACVKTNNSISLGFSPLSPSNTCPNCISNESIYFDSAALRLKTRSGETHFAMRADTVFPADAFKVFLEQPSGQLRISLKKMSSALAAEPCYNYNPSTGVLVFKASKGGDACPISVVGDAFVFRGREAITSDNLSLTLMLPSFPPVEITLRITLDLASAGSVVVMPVTQFGPSTPQLFYVLNQKNDLVSRTFKIESTSSQEVSLQGVGAEALAWRGPGSLFVSEAGTPLASLTYAETPTFYACTGSVGGDQLETAADWKDCMTGWCTPSAFSQSFDNFKTYARNAALSSAFRRGNGEPWKTVMGSEKFKQVMIAQVVDGAAGTIVSSGITLSGYTKCGNFSMPGVFEITAQTQNGDSFDYAAQVAGLKPFDYVDGSCANPYSFDGAVSRSGAPMQLLCRFLYGRCDTDPTGACIENDALGNMHTNSQNAKPNSGINTPSTMANLTNATNGTNNMLAMLPLLQQLSNMLQQLGKNNGGGGGGGGGWGGGDQQNPFNNGLTPIQQELLKKLPSHLYSPFTAKSNEDAKKGSKIDSLSKAPGSEADIPAKAKPLNEKYVEARKATDASCASPDAATTQEYSAVSLDGAKRTGTLRKTWLDVEKTANVKSAENEFKGACTAPAGINIVGITEMPFVCQPEAVFDMFDDVVKNGGEIKPDQTKLDESQPKRLKNNNFAITDIEKCEGAEHGPKDSETLAKIAPDKCADMKKNMLEKRELLDKAIETAKTGCVKWCDQSAQDSCGGAQGKKVKVSSTPVKVEAGAYPPALNPGEEYVFGLGLNVIAIDKYEVVKLSCEAQPIAACTAKCDVFAKAATKQLDEWLGTKEEIQKVYTKQGGDGKSGSGSGGTPTVKTSGSSSGVMQSFAEVLFDGSPLRLEEANVAGESVVTGRLLQFSAPSVVSFTDSKSCAASLNVELSKGDECELFNKQFAGGDGVKGLLVEPVGTDVRRTVWVDLYAGNAKEGGICYLVCQTANSFVQIVSASGKAFAIERFGMGTDCKQIAPQNSGKIPLDDGNALAKFINSYIPFGGSTLNAYTTTGYISGARITAQPGTGKFSMHIGSQPYDRLNERDNGGQGSGYQVGRQTVGYLTGEDMNNWDIDINYQQGYSSGNSYGNAITLGMYSAMTNIQYPWDITLVTGAIYPGMKVGEVGGYSDKSRVGINAGKKYAIIPPGGKSAFPIDPSGVRGYKNVYTVTDIRSSIAAMEDIARREGRDLGIGTPVGGQSNPGFTPYRRQPAMDLSQVANPFDEGGSGVLPSTGKFQSKDPKTGKDVLASYNLMDVFNAPFNAPPGLGSASKEVPGKTTRAKLVEQAKAKDSGNDKPFEDAIDRAKAGSPVIRSSSNPVNQEDLNKLISGLSGGQIPQQVPQQGQVPNQGGQIPDQGGGQTPVVQDGGQLIQSTPGTPPITVYSTDNCKYCVRALNLLTTPKENGGLGLTPGVDFQVIKNQKYNSFPVIEGGGQVITGFSPGQISSVVDSLRKK